MLFTLKDDVEAMRQKPVKMPRAAAAEKIHRTLGPCGIFGAIKLHELVARLELKLRAGGNVADHQFGEILEVIKETQAAFEEAENASANLPPALD